MKLTHELVGPVEIPDRPRRVVSLAPNATDAIFYLGLGELLVGRSAFCWRPEAAGSLPVVSSYTKVRWELLEELAPDLVLTTTAVQRETTRELAERGYPVWSIPLPNSPWGILENLHTLAALLGGEGAAAAAGLARRYLDLAGALAGVRVYLEYDLGGPITIGRGAFMHATLEHLGAVNVYADRAEAYFAPELERVPALAPDLLVFEPKRIRNREKQLEAVRQRLAERGWSGMRWTATRGDELAHFGPLFFDYLERWLEEARAVME